MRKPLEVFFAWTAFVCEVGVVIISLSLSLSFGAEGRGGVSFGACGKHPHGLSRVLRKPLPSGFDTARQPFWRAAADRAVPDQTARPHTSHTVRGCTGPVPSPLHCPLTHWPLTMGIAGEPEKALPAVTTDGWTSL